MIIEAGLIEETAKIAYMVCLREDCSLFIRIVLGNVESYVSLGEDGLEGQVVRSNVM